MADIPEPEPRLFTYEEASALLPTLRRFLADMQEAAARIASFQEELAERLGARSRRNGHAGPDPRADELARATEEAQQRLTAAVRAIGDLGCELKDPRRGMVDFRTMRDGRVVYLCWLLEEPSIKYWHEIEGGYAGRQPL